MRFEQAAYFYFQAAIFISTRLFLFPRSYLFEAKSSSRGPRRYVNKSIPVGTL